MSGWLTVRGRIASALPPRSLLQIIDLDPLLDDTIAVGWPHEDGRFELRFPVMAIRQDALEYERVPDRLRLDVFTDEEGKLLRRRAERSEPTFVNDVCELGDVTLGPPEPTDEDGLVRDHRSVRRARPTNASLADVVDEVRPHVAAWTGRRELLDDVRIELTDDLLAAHDGEPDAEGIREWLTRRSRRTSYAMMRHLGVHDVFGIYSPRRDCIYVDERFAARQPYDGLATLVAHELVHLSQFRGEPALMALAEARSRANAAAAEAAANHRELSSAERDELADAFAFTMAIEGHANAIERLVLRDHYRFGYHVMQLSSVAVALSGVVGIGVLAARTAASKLRALAGARAPLEAEPVAFEDPSGDATAWGLFEYARRFAECHAASAAPVPFGVADVAAARELATDRMARTAAHPPERRGAFRQQLGLVAEELLYGLVTLEEAERQIR